MRLVMMTLALVLVLSGGSASAYIETGNKLFSKCMDKELALNAVCTGYIIGVSDALGSLDILQKFKVCMPDNVPVAQIRDVTTRWLEQNPAQRHFQAAWLVPIALAEAFPCPK